jgi:hypothetical protein
VYTYIYTYIYALGAGYGEAVLAGGSANAASRKYLNDDDEDHHDSDNNSVSLVSFSLVVARAHDNDTNNKCLTGGSAYGAGPRVHRRTGTVLQV